MVLESSVIGTKGEHSFACACLIALKLGHEAGAVTP